MTTRLPPGRIKNFFASEKERVLFTVIPVLLAAVFAALRLPLDATMHTMLLTKSYLHPDSLMQNPLVRATLVSAWTLAPGMIAHGFARLYLFAHVSPHVSIACLQLTLWITQAALMYRLALAATGDDAAAFLATLIFGAEMPLVWADAAYSLEFLERSLGMVPLLWGTTGLIRGRRWEALIGVSMATYLHASPAIYVWPWVILEDALESWKDPRARTGIFLRMILLAAIALPMISSVGFEPHSEREMDYMRFTVALFASWIGGGGMVPADRLFILEGLILIALAVRRRQKIPAYPVLMRAVALCFIMILAGSGAYLTFLPGSAIWRLLIKLQLWISQYLVELAGEIFIASWLVSAMRKGSVSWPILLNILAFSYSRDFILRFLAICLLLVSERAWWVAVLTVGGASISFLYRLHPTIFWIIIRLLGLHGGFVSLPVFHAKLGFALILCLATGFVFHRHFRARREALNLSLLGAAGILFLAVWARGASAHRAQSSGAEQVADWARQHTLENTTIALSPLDVLGMPGEPFMARSERSLFVCPEYHFAIIVFGARGVPLIEKLGVYGIDLHQVHNFDDYEEQIQAADRKMTPQIAALWKTRYNVSYLLMRAGRPWPIKPVYQAGSLALYPVDSERSIR